MNTKKLFVNLLVSAAIVLLPIWAWGENPLPNYEKELKLDAKASCDNDKTFVRGYGVPGDPYAVDEVTTGAGNIFVAVVYLRGFEITKVVHLLKEKNAAGYQELKRQDWAEKLKKEAPNAHILLFNLGRSDCKIKMAD